MSFMLLHTGFSPTLVQFPTANNKTEANARQACTDAFNANPTIQTCLDNIDLDLTTFIDVCMEDFKVSETSLFKFALLFPIN